MPVGKRLAEKVAVVTGAGSGMGAAIAETFCREGAKVVAADISGRQNDVAERLGRACIPCHADVSDGGQVRAMFDLALSTFGRLDIVANNAGIAGALARTGELDEAEFDRIWSINGRGMFLVMRYAIPLLEKAGGGSIINTASISSLIAIPRQPAYCAAKGAVLMLTRTAAAEYAASNIRINAICPGPVMTGLTENLPQRHLEKVVEAVPLGRIGKASEIADAALFLASDESSFITGTTIVVDGGYTAL